MRPQTKYHKELYQWYILSPETFIEVMEKLSNEERTILRYRIGVENSQVCTLEEIAEKCGVSRTTIRRKMFEIYRLMIKYKPALEPLVIEDDKQLRHKIVDIKFSRKKFWEVCENALLDIYAITNRTKELGQEKIKEINIIINEALHHPSSPPYGKNDNNVHNSE